MAYLSARRVTLNIEFRGELFESRVVFDLLQRSSILRGFIESGCDLPIPASAVRNLGRAVIAEGAPSDQGERRGIGEALASGQHKERYSTTHTCGSR